MVDVHSTNIIYVWTLAMWGSFFPHLIMSRRHIAIESGMKNNAEGINRTRSGVMPRRAKMAAQARSSLVPSPQSRLRIAELRAVVGLCARPTFVAGYCKRSLALIGGWERD